MPVGSGSKAESGSEAESGSGFKNFNLPDPAEKGQDPQPCFGLKLKRLSIIKKRNSFKLVFICYSTYMVIILLMFLFLNFCYRYRTGIQYDKRYGTGMIEQNSKFTIVSVIKDES